MKSVVKNPPSFPLLPSVLFLFLACSCSVPRPQHGGHATTTGGLAQTLVQSDNPSQPSRQSQDSVRTRTYFLPAPGLHQGVEAGSPLPVQGRGDSAPNTAQTSSIKIPPTIQVTDREETHATTELGAAQKDTAREIGAKLSSLRSITWVGLALFVLGLVSLFWPPLKTVIGSVTTSAAITVGGLGLIVLPTLIVGNELPILGGVLVAVGGWFIAHRHGHLRGQLHAATQPKRTGGGAVLI